MTKLNEAEIYFSHLLSPWGILNTSKYPKRNTYPIKSQNDIDVEAERFIKRKKNHIKIDNNVDLKTEGFIKQKGTLEEEQQQQDDIFVDVKAEEFIKKKKLELSKLSHNVIGK
ncbi:unnamed protein product [Amaranthus hypochondriacus]